MSMGWNGTRDPTAPPNKRPPRPKPPTRSESKHRTLPKTWWPLFPRPFSVYYMGVCEKPVKYKMISKKLELTKAQFWRFFWVDYAEEKQFTEKEALFSLFSSICVGAKMCLIDEPLFYHYHVGNISSMSIACMVFVAAIASLWYYSVFC